jgi:hypothetical protein
MKFQHFENIWKRLIQKLGLNGLNKKKFARLRNTILAKRRSSPTPSNIPFFFGCIIPHNKNGSHYIQFEKDLVLFIAQELVFLSFVAIS